jgi:hypothetical protein
MKIGLLSTLGGLALLVGGCGKADLGRDPYLPNPSITQPALVRVSIETARKEIKAYDKDGKVEHLKTAYDLFLDIGSSANAMACAKTALSNPKYTQEGRLMLKDLNEKISSNLHR